MEMAKKFTVNLPQALDKKLADIADVSEKTYRMSAKVINSDNKDVKQRVWQFSKAERIDYARRLERIESLKAKERMSDGSNAVRRISDIPQRTDGIVSKKLGIGSRDTYRKEKYIVDNQKSLSLEDYTNWDEGKLSTNPVKLGRCFEFLNNWYGFEHGGDRKSEGQNGLLTLSEIAKQLGLSEKSLKRVLSIERNLTDSMKELLDTGEITKTFGSDPMVCL